MKSIHIYCGGVSQETHCVFENQPFQNMTVSLWWLCRELGHSCVVQLSCCDTSLPLQQLPAPLLPLPHCPVLHKGRCLHPSLQARLSPFRVSSTHWGSRKTSTACLACEDWLQRLENRGSWALHAWPISYCHVQPKWPRDFTLRC